MAICRTYSFVRGGDVLARPLKDGIDYFPFDVGFLQDKKIRLIKGEYGIKGVVIVIQLLCSIYKENGYFSTCDSDDFILVADAVGCGCDAKTIEEVVQGCLRRSIFDRGVFEAFGVLTSRGIQRRYLRALSTRDNIDIFQEYWLLDINDKKDVPASISKKITFKNVSLQINTDKTQINSVNLQNNPQSKVKKSRVKESKVEEIENTAFGCDSGIAEVFQTFEHCGFKITGYARDELVDMVEIYSAEWVVEAVKRAAKRGKKNISYIEGILRSWDDTGAMDDENMGAGNTESGCSWEDI